VNAVLLFCALLLAFPTEEEIGGHPYAKLETRAATLARMLDLLVPEEGDWGTWHLLSPFPYAGHGQGDLATVLEPEAELSKMAAGGPGPDLAAVYAGKLDVEARWRELGEVANRRVDLHVHDRPELDDLACCYLYTTVSSDRARSVELSMGSDDGLRFWLNGRLLIDVDVPRSLDPHADLARLELEQGVNHVLAKVCEGHGAWEFQINTRARLDARLDAELQNLLERDFPRTPEREYWRVYTYPVPDDVVLEVGGLAVLADGRPVVTTRRGDVFLVENAYQEPPTDARLVHFAEGLHEPLGAAVRQDLDGEAVYAVQRGELTRMRDVDGDGSADEFETVCDDWGLSGDYHEFAFGPKFDRAGNAWVTLNVGFCGPTGKSTVPWRGWAVKITPVGELIPVCSGLRSPNGIGMWRDGEMFYVDNQGDYVATNRLSHLAPGSWHGHVASLRWRDDLAGPDDRPPRQPASVWFPYRKMGQSAADIVLDETGGAFGPFAQQFFVGDQFYASIMRVDLEVVEGHYQGVCFPFLEQLDSGVNRLCFAPDGSLLVGMTDRGWGSVGRKTEGLQRVAYSGRAPFEIRTMRALEHGFELELTQDVDPATAQDPGAYAMTSYTYEYHPDYGAPEDDTLALALAPRLSGPRTIELAVDPLRAGYVHELSAHGLRSARDGKPLLHDKAYYTLINVPGGRQHDQARVEPARQGPLRVLFLTHSAGFVHSVVKRPEPDVPAYAEERLIEAAGDGFEITATQDCAAITPENLARYDAVAFYTTGELPISAANRAALMDWIRRGGAFAGVHCATDTLYEYEPYQTLIGGAFDGHPWHEEVRVRVEDRGHPSTEHLGQGFTITDEIYQFRNFARHPLHVLLGLDPDSVEIGLGRRADGDYAVSWCRDWGRGRVFYTSLGHREEVWDDARFTRHLLAGMRWAVAGPYWSPPPPEAALALTPGGDLSAWRGRDGGDCGWTPLEGGAVEVAPGTGDALTRAEFGDCLLHVEFMPPDSPPEAQGQGRGNSGVYLQGRYEVQVLDSFGVEPGLGDCGAIYGKKIPDVDACRPPGTWQSYDIFFRAPRFDDAGAKSESARMTVWHNGMRIHADVEVDGPTTAALSADEVARGPLLLQDHGQPVRYRNVWIVPH